MRLPQRLFVWFSFFASRRIIFRFAECANQSINQSIKVQLTCCNLTSSV
jgi:hypothetical protein